MTFFIINSYHINTVIQKYINKHFKTMSAKIRNNSKNKFQKPPIFINNYLF